MFSFNFRGKNSYEDFGILIEKKPPIPMPQRNVENIKVPGRSSSLTIDEGAYDDITITVECNFVSEELKQEANKIKAWLMGGQDKLIFSDELDKYYIAQVVNKFDIVQSIKVFGEFPLLFNCKPFKKNVNDLNIFKICEVNVIRNSLSINPLSSYNYVSGEVIAANTPIEINKVKEFTIWNVGNIESRPIIKLYGSGDISITINSSTFTIKDVQDSVTVDGELEDCYKDTELWNNKMIGEFPVLNPGENKLSYTGNLNYIEINPNTEYI